MKAGRSSTRKTPPKQVLKFHDLDQAKSAVISSLPSRESQRGYGTRSTSSSPGTAQNPDCPSKRPSTRMPATPAQSCRIDPTAHPATWRHRTDRPPPRSCSSSPKAHQVIILATVASEPLLRTAQFGGWPPRNPPRYSRPGGWNWFQEKEHVGWSALTQSASAETNWLGKKIVRIARPSYLLPSDFECCFSDTPAFRDELTSTELATLQ